MVIKTLLTALVCVLFHVVGHAAVDSLIYARTFAVEYARTYASASGLTDNSGYNKNYPDFSLISGGVDCANFASQVLHHGFIPMVSQGFPVTEFQLNSTRSSGLGSIDESNSHFVRLDDVAIYPSDSSGSQDQVTRSLSWAYASALYNYLIDNKVGKKINEADLNNDNLRLGDLIFIKGNGRRFNHVMVVTSFDENGIPRLTGHTNNRLDFPLTSAKARYSAKVEFSGVHILGVLDYVSPVISSIKATLGVHGVASPILRLKVIVFGLLDYFGIGSSVAASDIAVAAVGDDVTLTVYGDKFYGTERLSIEDADCNIASLRYGTNWFSQVCRGRVAGQNKIISIIDSDRGATISIPEQYKFIGFIAPVIAPNSPSLSDIGSGTVRVNWVSVSGASGYIVARNDTDVATLGATTTYDDAGRTYGSQVCYRVRALANGVMSVFSPEACITPAAPSQCPNSWSGGYTPIGGSESTVQSCPSGQVGSITLYHVCQASGSGAMWSGTSTTNTCTQAPVSAPSGVAAARYTQGATKGIKLTWSAVSGADSYLVYKLGVNGIYAPLGNQTSFIDTLNLRSGTSYCYTVRAQSGNRVSVDSDVACSLAP